MLDCLSAGDDVWIRYLYTGKFAARCAQMQSYSSQQRWEVQSSGSIDEAFRPICAPGVDTHCAYACTSRMLRNRSLSNEAPRVTVRVAPGHMHICTKPVFFKTNPCSSSSKWVQTLGPILLQ